MLKNNNYEDIINLPYKKSKNKPHMSIMNRAAQFAPFSALTGFEDASKETARYVNSKIILDDNFIEILNYKLNKLNEHIHDNLIVEIKYFVNDTFKQGGKYINYTGKLIGIDSEQQLIILENNLKINIKDIMDINSDIFNSFLGSI